MAGTLRAGRAGRAGGRPGSPALACALVVLSLALTSSRHAVAEPGAGHSEQVLTLYRVGRQLFDAGRIDEACGVLEQARRLDPTAINLLLRLGECFSRMGRTASAWRVFDEAAALAKSAHDPRAARASELAGALDPRLSRLTIAVSAAGAAAGVEVRRDGVPVPPAQWGKAIPIDPGAHTIEARAPGRRRWSVTRSVGTEGAHVTVEVPALEDDAPPDRVTTVAPRRARATRPPSQATAAASRARDAGGRANPMIALVGGGVGLAGLGVGTGFGLLALAKRNASNDGHCGAQNRCDAAGVALRAEAQAAGTASTVAFSVGAAALVAGGVLWWLALPVGKEGRGRRASTPEASAVIGPGVGALVVRGSY